MTKGTILMVDDDPQSLRLLTVVLMADGYDILQAAGGRMALSILAEEPCLMMITDLQMPGMDGLELSSLVSRLNPWMPIVLLTGAVSPQLYRDAPLHGICRVVAKPFRVLDVLEVINAAVSDRIAAVGGLK